MQLEVGAVYEGKVTGITKFGAFVSLPEGKSGLVHISEIANKYVSDVSEYVSMGQSVRVCVIGIKDGKINLSMKRVETPAEPKQSRRKPDTAAEPGADAVFEDKLKKFMQESDSRISGSPMYADRGRSRRRK